MFSVHGRQTRNLSLGTQTQTKKKIYLLMDVAKQRLVPDCRMWQGGRRNIWCNRNAALNGAIVQPHLDDFWCNVNI